MRPYQVLCLILSMSILSAAQGPTKQSPASRQLAGWLTAYDGTDWKLTSRF
jgi:hypothetical protein